MNTLNGGSYNLLNSRDPSIIKDEVNRLLDKHDLDFLVVQEANDYWNVLNHIAGYEFFATTKYKGGNESGILVKDSLKASRPRYTSFGDGWITVRGGHHAATTMPRVTIDGWLRVAAVHMPTPVLFARNGVTGPSERVDDYMALARKIYSYLRPRRGSRLVLGDWNESPSTTNMWSPAWIAHKTGSVIKATESRAGHGRIDYPVGKNVELINVRKDLDIREGSDHEPVVFTVRQK